MDEKIQTSIEQFKSISIFFETHNSTLQSPQSSQIDEFYRQFYLLCQQFTTEDISIKDNEDEQLKRIETIKTKLPENFIYCPDNSPKNRFLPLESLAFNVKYSCEPTLMKLPSVYVKDHRNRNFFEKLGIKSEFSMPMLNQKLLDLKTFHAEKQLDPEAISLCLTIVKEMINQEKGEDLKPFVDSLEVCYLLDETNVLRDIKQLCSRSVGDSTINLDGLHFLHSEIPEAKFGIQNFKSKFFAKIGKPFGQREKLTDRIKDILERYSSQYCFFKVIKKIKN
jgi:hypothetical protein